MELRNPPQLTLFAAGSRDCANPGASQERKAAQMTTVISGQKCAGLLPKSGLSGSLQKMCRALMTGNLWVSTECSLTWQHSATQQSRLKFRLVPSICPTVAPDCGLWHTPESHPRTHTPRKCAHGTVPLANQVQETIKANCGLWPTPNVPNGGRSIKHAEMRGGTAYTKDGKKVQVGLESAARETAALWATPRANDAEKRGQIAPDPRNGLPAQALWATPRTADSKGQQVSKERREAGKIDNLSQQVKCALWATPTTQDAKNNAGPSQFNRNSYPLNVEAVAAHLDGSPDGTEKRGALSARFVSALMGYPTNWLE